MERKELGLEAVLVPGDFLDVDVLESGALLEESVDDDFV